jgi:hypothetical protein
VIAATVLLIVAVGVASSLIGFSTPGYAGEGTSNLILRALLQETPTPVPTPVAAACGVHISPRMAIATDTVGVDLWNEGAAATVRAITLAWPVEDGDLVEVLFGGRHVWGGVETDGSATIFPDTAEMMPTIKAGEQTGLTLRFSNGAVEGPYTVLLHLGKGCYALFDSTETTSQVQSCFATFDRFSVDGQEAVLKVTNTTAEPLSFSRLRVFWPDDLATIDSIQIDGETSYVTTAPEHSPIDIALPTNPGITLLPEQSSRIKLHFSQRAPLVGYTIVLETNECQSVFSNVEPPSECPVYQEDGLQIAGETAGLVLKNLGEAGQPIERIWLTFPATNAALVDVVLNDSSIVNPSSGLFPKTSSPATMTAGIDILPDVTLPPNSQSTVGFVFNREAGLQHYTVELDFSDECRVLTTTRAEELIPCQMEVDGDAPVRTEANRVRLAIRNTGEIQAELQALQIDWAAQFNGALTGVALGGIPFWEGSRTEGTATVTHNTDNVVPAVEPGQSVELEMTFANAVVPAPYVFRLDFAEGCRLSYATQPDQAMPVPVAFIGTIYQLPANAFDGTWQIRLPSSQILSVQVMPQTVIEPPELTPRINDFVRMQALPTGNDEFLATYVRVTPNVAEPTEFSGVIEEVDSQQPPRYIRVQSTTVDIVPETEIQGTLAEGWIADVDGFRRADGLSVLARSIHTTQPPSNARRVDFEGVVEGWEQVSEGEARWMVSNMRVIIYRDSTVLHGIQWGSPPETGTEVRIAGNMIGARTVEAIEVWYGPGAEIQEFDGVIRQLPDMSDGSPPIGIWIIEDSAIGTCNPAEDPAAEACKRVLVTESTFLDISEASPAVGASVQVRARQNPDGNLEGLWIRILPQE